VTPAIHELLLKRVFTPMESDDEFEDRIWEENSTAGEWAAALQEWCDLELGTAEARADITSFNRYLKVRASAYIKRKLWALEPQPQPSVVTRRCSGPRLERRTGDEPFSCKTCVEKPAHYCTQVEDVLGVTSAIFHEELCHNLREANPDKFEDSCSSQSQTRYHGGPDAIDRAVDPEADPRKTQRGPRVHEAEPRRRERSPLDLQTQLGWFCRRDRPLRRHGDCVASSSSSSKMQASASSSSSSSARAAPSPHCVTAKS